MPHVSFAREGKASHLDSTERTCCCRCCRASQAVEVTCGYSVVVLGCCKRTSGMLGSSESVLERCTEDKEEEEEEVNAVDMKVILISDYY